MVRLCSLVIAGGFAIGMAAPAFAEGGCSGYGQSVWVPPVEEPAVTAQTLAPTTPIVVPGDSSFDG